MYFITLAVGRFLYFDSTLEDIRDTLQGVAKNLPLLVLMGSYSAIVCWYGSTADSCWLPMVSSLVRCWRIFLWMYLSLCWIRHSWWNCLFRLLLIHQPILFNADQFKISLYRSIWYFNTLFQRRKILKIYFLEQRIHQAYKDGIRHFIISAADRDLIAPEVTRDHYSRKSGVFRTVTICMKYSRFFILQYTG